MISEMILTTEGFSANIAGIRSLIGVGPFVNEQIVGFGELSIAKFADELFFGSLSRQPAI